MPYYLCEILAFLEEGDFPSYMCVSDTKAFFHLLHKLHTYFYVFLIYSGARILL